jgi:V-type H+-transporting ATPase subunit F
MSKSAKGKAIKVKGSLAFGVIGDEPTVTGFLLSGIGERHQKHGTNFLIVDKDTPWLDIEKKFEKLCRRDDIEIILINQNVAKDFRDHITVHEQVIPTILEIPSKNVPYDPTKYSILLLAARQLYGSDNIEVYFNNVGDSILVNTDSSNNW